MNKNDKVELFSLKIAFLMDFEGVFSFFYGGFTFFIVPEVYVVRYQKSIYFSWVTNFRIKFMLLHFFPKKNHTNGHSNSTRMLLYSLVN